MENSYSGPKPKLFFGALWLKPLSRHQVSCCINADYMLIIYISFFSGKINSGPKLKIIFCACIFWAKTENYYSGPKPFFFFCGALWSKPSSWHKILCFNNGDDYIGVIWAKNEISYFVPKKKFWGKTPKFISSLWSKPSSRHQVLHCIKAFQLDVGTEGGYTEMKILVWKRNSGCTLTERPKMLVMCYII